jgi:hypothetical protein
MSAAARLEVSIPAVLLNYSWLSVDVVETCMTEIECGEIFPYNGLCGR